MAYDSVSKLTAKEMVALAFIEFKHSSFTLKNLTYFLCCYCKERFHYKYLPIVQNLVQQAKTDLNVMCSEGDIHVSSKGAFLLAQVKPPREYFQNETAKKIAKTTQALLNPGDLFDYILSCEITCGDRNFVESVKDHWLIKGWISLEQAILLVGKSLKLGMDNGHLPASYVGMAAPEWHKPYLDAIKQEKVRNDLALKQRKRDLENQFKADKVAREANENIKNSLKEMNLKNQFSNLSTLVEIVFPGVCVSEHAKKMAFCGRGKNELKICVAAIAFGKPPDKIWSLPSVKHQDENSKQWQKLISHPVSKEYCPLLSVV